MRTSSSFAFALCFAASIACSRNDTPAPDGGNNSDAGGDAGPLPAPTVTAIAPATGALDGGTAVEVTGTNFVSNASLRIGGASAVNVAVVSATKITARTPAGAVGKADVVVVNPDAQLGRLTQGFTYSTPAPVPTVSWCTLQSPKVASGHPGDSMTFYGQAFAAGVTDAAGAGNGVKMQLAVVASGVTPAETDWKDAVYNKDDGNNDEYQRTVTLPAAGGYSTSFRARLGSSAWTICEADGPHDTYAPAAAGTLTVADLVVGFCNLQSFPSTAEVGKQLTLKGRVYVATVTDQVGQGPGLKLQVGFGPDISGLVWSDATYESDVDGLSAGNHANDQYSATLIAPSAAGTSFAAYRASVNNGATYVYCGTDGLHAALADAALASIAVTVAPPPTVQFCNFQFASATSGAPGDPLTLYSQVYQPGLTDAVGQGPGITVDLGVGPAGSLDPSAYTWTNAHYARDIDVGVAGNHSNDEYQLVTAFPAAGARSYVFRAKLDPGAYQYCETDGLHPGLTAAGLKTITSAAPPSAIGDCVLQFPAVADNVFPNQPFNLYGRVFVAGTTEATGAGSGVQMQASIDVKPDGGATWIDAGFNGDIPSGAQAGWEEYRATATTPAPGHYATAFRAQVNDGGWSFCEVGGKSAIFDAADAGSLTVRQNSVDYCRMMGPSAASGYYADPVTVYGEVYVAGVTPPSGAAAGLAVEAGYGQPDGGGFNWVPAQYDPSATFGNGRISDTNNDGYAVAIPMPIPGSYATAMRAAYNGGAWTYCELGSNGTAAFVAADAGALVVQPAAVGDCYIQYPKAGDAPGLNLAAGQPQTYYGHVLAPGLARNGQGRFPGIVGQVGIGPIGTAPSGANWSFLDASFAPGCTTCGDNSDEHAVTLGLAQRADAGVVFRFSGDGRQTWLYCDQTAGNGFDTADESRYVTRNNPDFDSCRLTAAASAGGADAGVDISATVAKAGGDPDYAVINPEVRVGPAGTDPGGPGWMSVPAGFDGGDISAAAGSTWTATVHADAGNYGVAFRFQHVIADNAWWSYAAADGGCATGFQPAAEGSLTLTAP